MTILKLFHVPVHVKGVRFLPNCPDHIKERCISRGFSTHQAQLSDHDFAWVRTIDEIEYMWWIPMFGLFTDAQVERVKVRIINTLNIFGRK